MKKYKIVEKTHRDGSKTYDIKVRVLPFVWVYAKEDCALYNVIYKGMDKETAFKKMLELVEGDKRKKAKKVVKKEVIKYS